MKYILGNDGNRRYFEQCLGRNKREAPYGEVRHSFTVNVWVEGKAPSYDAGFYVGSGKRRRENSGIMSAQFKRGGAYWQNVGYRIRVWPKP